MNQNSSIGLLQTIYFPKKNSIPYDTDYTQYLITICLIRAKAHLRLTINPLSFYLHKTWHSAYIRQIGLHFPIPLLRRHLLSSTIACQRRSRSSYLVSEWSNKYFEKNCVSKFLLLEYNRQILLDIQCAIIFHRVIYSKINFSSINYHQEYVCLE